MACVISASSSNSGKTLLCLLLIAWLKSIKKTVQPFKVGPDYLDPQQLSAVSNKACRNLDLILSGEKWVKESFNHFGGLTDFSIVEGVMGLFDGIGSSSKGSTAELAKVLGLPIVLIVDARGKAASLAALIKGFQEHDKELKIEGIVLNNVQTPRHEKILLEVLSQINVKPLGCIPKCQDLYLPSRHLGLAPIHEIQNLDIKVKKWASIAKNYLDVESFKKLLLPHKSQDKIINYLPKKDSGLVHPIAIAEDEAFHFRYQETKELLEKNGMPTIRWKPLENKQIPNEAKGLIIPGGFPEQHAEQLSNSKISLKSINIFAKKFPIYAECGGMMLLGKSIFDLEGKEHSMAGILPFKAKKGNLKIGYREAISKNKSPVIDPGNKLIGHEFHRWEIINEKHNSEINPLWDIKGWNIELKNEGFCNHLIHASWIHLHWASSPEILNNWKKTVINCSKESA
ncbi:cobyrinate a,c-diamide synthase [Prochlorococcus marinus]|uniref:Cobyrinate a,c-diamide synthase n=1 Tax=Prochlorococcus marinus XMU1408 TaxID=2213228 RepID=A0A318R3X3_PROMR|nr:cobyrinate a,c-diamide synthase [Prochlorococcus marinus]MBW3042285.1 cobyrinate a,c-diamide synthase [Prochlorococcus marinus str. XMU1408]PYE01673.1 cobyrinate a,c-diamide synthase [Prochlorococcus marinus XMU1408]